MRKSFNGGKWTPARFHSFIKGHLRSASRRWAPIQEVKKSARVSRGLYLCNSCKQLVPTTILNDKNVRVKNVFVDHIIPVVDPTEGFTSWDEVVERMFCEKEGLQLLCKSCHDKKTQEERAMRYGNS